MYKVIGIFPLKSQFELKRLSDGKVFYIKLYNRNIKYGDVITL